MDERTRWITYRRRDVLVHDYTKLDGNDYSEAIKQRVEEILTQRRHDVLLLLDVTDSVVDKNVLTAFKHAGKDIEPYVQKLAVLGVTGVQKFFLRLINQFSGIGAEPFDTEKEALEWLIK